jgi:acetoin utilization deacetylase AcuC-like enzyme
VNIPLPGGTGDDDYLFAFDTIISPVVKQFKPEIILVSYGVDGLIGDPYGSLGLSVDGFRAIGTRIGMLGKLLCDHRIGVFLEGGYNYDMMGEATVNFFSGLLFPENYEKTMLSPGNEIQRVVFNVRSIHRNYWYGL